MKKKLFLFLVTLLIAVTAMAQDHKVTGKVVDANGEPLIGVGVMVKGTTTGVATDLDGAFELNVPDGAVLEISSIGYVSQDITVGDKTNLEITLQDDTQLLEGTVVVGYGTVKRTNFTGSVSTVKVSEGGVSLTTPTSATDLLRGLTPGLSMSQSGVAGATPSIQIRGQKSISGGSQPLIVLDGVIFKGTMNDIDPSMVESMSVLKDATSLAAYGSQAANGVIMITSKKGKIGKPMINFRTTLSLLTPNYKPDLRDGYQYIERYNAVKNNPEGDVSWMSDIEQEQYKKGKQYDWFDYTTRLGVRQNYSLNVSGGNEKMNYMVGGSYLDDKNFIKGNEFIRENLTANVNSTISDYIRAGVNVNFSNYANDGVQPGVGRMYSPWGNPVKEDGSMRKYILGNNPDQLNPLWSTYNGVDNEVRNNSITLGGNIEVKFPWIKGLSYKITGNYTIRNQRNRNFTHELNLVKATDGDDYSSAVTDKYLNLASGSITNTRSDSWVLDNILTYTREIGPHWINATLVYTRDSQKLDGSTVTGSDFADLGNTTLGFYGLDNATTQHISNISYTLHNDIGYLARVNYSYKDTYHFNASFRRDGSSVFGKDHKWGNFPAVGVAWTISNENFWKEKISWADNVKVKLSWGKNGNQSLQPYSTLSKMNVGRSGGYAYYFDDSVIYAQSLATLGNPNLGWETTVSWNYGVEGDLLKGRIHAEIDAYNSKTTDQIFTREVLSMGAGIHSQASTMGQVNNWGIESSIRSINISKNDFTWTTQLNFSINRNKLKELYGDGKDDITNELFLDKSLGAIYGYKWIGVVQETDTDYIAANGAQPGDPMYANLDGSEDGKISPSDKTILGYNKEAFRLSIANTFTYKNWSLYFMLNGIFSGGMYGKAQNNFAYGSQDGSMDYLNSNDHPYWTPENKSNKYLRPGYDVTNGDFKALQKYGFIRLQDLNLAYNLNSAFVKKFGIESLQLYVSGSNLFFIAPNWKFSDPEIRSSRAMQLARTYTFGVNVRF